MSVSNNTGNYTRLRRKRPKIVTISARKERNLSIKKVSVILQKDESLRTKEEKDLLFNYSEIVKEAALRIEKRKQLKERLKEIEDSEVVMDAKCKQLAEAILKSEYMVAYTGAGISTAARIPDYRGAAGIWTLLQQGKEIGNHDLTQADPTFTHMALFQLYLEGKLKHIVSQNCDGLHLRSGFPKRALSEVHGNMYIEVCKTCRPVIEYLRLFDVTENTGRYSHRTMRKCYKCNSSLVDSIVHFGERGSLPWPLNWKGACKAAEKADMILCIGSSLKVLKRYPWLWCMDKPAKRRPLIYIVNLQWTPKDCHAVVKINGKCDIVMEKLMKYLSIPVPEYSRKSDPIFEHATHLCKEERHTKNRPFLTVPKLEKPQEEMAVKPESCDEVFKKGIKEEKFDCAIISNHFASEPQESCVTSCKKEIVIDTGQGDDAKCIKKELIVITIRSGNNFIECCNLFKVNQSHECGCPNFIDEQNDIPVIIEDDFLVLKNNMESQVKAENLRNGSPSNSGCGIEVTAQLQKSNFAQNNSLKSSRIEEKQISVCKRAHDSDNLDSQKKQKLNEDSIIKLKEKNAFGFLKKTSSVFDSQASDRTNKLGNSSKQKGGNESVKCSFCSEHYLSNTCLFYVKREPVFKANVPICDCCSSEGEETEAEASDEKATDLQYNTNPGWYGKGLRKNRKKSNPSPVEDESPSLSFNNTPKNPSPSLGTPPSPWRLNNRYYGIF